MIDRLKELLQEQLTPNGYYILWCIGEGHSPPKLLNFALETRLLRLSGFLDKTNKLTDKANKILNLKSEIEDNSSKKLTFEQFVTQYRLLFPPGKIFGYPKRDSLADLKDQFLKWLKVYKYSYEHILKVTQEYVNEEMGKGGRYLKSSYYLIAKKGEPSLLAKLCEEHGETNSTEKVDFNEEI